MTSYFQGAKETTYNGDLTKAAIVLLNRNMLNDLNCALAAAGAAMATNTTGIKTVNSVPYLLNGNYQTALSATNPFWTLTGGNLAAGFMRAYLLCIGPTAGTAAVIQSSNDVPTSVGASGIQFVTQTGAIDPWNGYCIVSNVLISNGTTSPFVPATTALNTASLTVTYADGPGLWLYPIVGGLNTTTGTTNAGIGPVSYLG
jgi:hypothetical protein